VPFLTHSVNQGLVAKEAQNKKIFELWLTCYTQEEIAEKVELSVGDKSLRISGKWAELPNNAKPYADHLVDFTPPVYNAWKFKERTPVVSKYCPLPMACQEMV